MSEGLMIQDMAPQDRPRERLLKVGAKNLKNEDLLAILLRTGTKGVSALQIAAEILRRYQTLNQLSRASVDELCKIKGIGRDKAITLLAAFTLARNLMGERPAEQLADTPNVVADLLREEMRNEPVETFFVILLNTRRHLIRYERLTQGTLNTLLVHPREVFRAAIAANASAIILAHNHPSGDPSPSDADVRVTRDLIRAGQVLRIDVLDHVIMGLVSPERDRDYVSLRELGHFH
ncbi:MAG: DNA repair protein RadC [Verrucomicrobiota bacterium]